MGKIYISQNEIILNNCCIRDIIEAVKGIEMLQQKITTIQIKQTFDFDTKYYHRLSESTINDLYNKLLTECNVELNRNTNRFYIDGIILPKVDIYKCVVIKIN